MSCDYELIQYCLILEFVVLIYLMFLILLCFYLLLHNIHCINLHNR